MAHSPLEQFVVRPLIPFEIGGVDLSFTQSSLWMLLGVLCATALMTLTMRGRAMIPGRWQNVGESFYEFVSNLVTENLGEDGRRYFPFVFTVFMLVLMGNLLGMVPYSFTYTSHIIVTFALALTVFITATMIGIFRHGLHFFSLFLPAGLPIALAPMIILIEIVSYLSRPISLSVRLFANMVAGHTMLKVFAGFSVAMGAILGILPMVVTAALVGLELMIAFIQAYVFAILTCLYIKSAIELH